MKVPKKNNQPDIHLGEQLEVFQNPFQCLKQIRKILAVVNALLRMRVHLANGDASISLTGEGGLLVDLTKLKASGGEGGNVVARGEWIAATDSPYMIGHLVYVRGTANAGAYISKIDNNPDTPWNSLNWDQYANNAGAMGVWQ